MIRILTEDIAGLKVSRISIFLIRYYPEFFAPATSVGQSDFCIFDWLETEEQQFPDLSRYSGHLKKFILMLNAKIEIRRKFQPNFRQETKLVDNNIRLSFDGITNFTSLDLDPGKFNSILAPLSYNLPGNVSQPDLYWQDFSNENHRQVHQRVFFSGSMTHVSRSIVPEINAINDSRFDVGIWQPVGQDSSKRASPYGTNKPVASEYETYFSKLLRSDIALCIRGDRIWTYSFLDYLRANNVVCFVNADHRVLGFEKIGLDPEEMFFFFNTDNCTYDDIYRELSAALDNKLKISKMKKRIHAFYADFIMSDRLYRASRYHPLALPWLDFYAGKLMEIKEHSYLLQDRSFFTPHVLTIKGLGHSRNRYRSF